MISMEQVAVIRRLYFGEHWKVGTIAGELGLHPDTVKRAIGVDLFASKGRCAPSQLDPYYAFIEATLQQHPRLRATRIHEMLVQRGYRGSVVQLRRAVRRLRPSCRAEAYFRLHTQPGAEGQSDWGNFGHIEVGRARRGLSAFVMTLSWSRGLNALFTLDQQMDSFLRGHVESFEYFGGVPRVMLYDNLKSAVLQRQGTAIQYNPALLELSAHYHFEPRPVGVARGNEKGRVERAIRYLRESFFAARTFHDVDDLNRQFRQWRENWASARKCPGDDTLTVREALDREREVLMPLPEHRFPCHHLRAVRSGKTPYVRFDLNDYSIPYELVRKPLSLLATRDQVRILDGDKEVAVHPRSYDRGELVEDERHLSELADFKRSAREARGMTRLFRAVPRSREFLEQVVERGQHAATATRQLERLLDEYGPGELAQAVGVALERGSVTPSSISHLLEIARRKQRAKMPLSVELPNDPRVRNLAVTPHRLEDYDELI